MASSTTYSNDKIASVDKVMSFTKLSSDALNLNLLSVALIGPSDQQRRFLAAAIGAATQTNAVREFATYPSLDEVSGLGDFDVVILDLDGNPEHALDLVETLCTISSATVMVYSSNADPELLVRCMRAGAREFLLQPTDQGMLVEALVRASARRPQQRSSTPRQAVGKLFVFAGVKGGSGVSTLAANYAVAAAKNSGQKVLLIDFALPLGGIALELGVNCPFSIANAIESTDRLDAHLLSTLLVKHSSGLFVLPAPDRYTRLELTNESVNKLLTVARQEFDHVIVDVGSALGSALRPVFDDATTIYLVAQVSLSQLRNANRIITEYFQSSTSRLEVVLNRYSNSILGIDEEAIAKALTVPVKWRIPNDFPTVERAHNTATPFALEESAIATSVREMAQSGCGYKLESPKRKRFGLFR